MGVVNDLCTRAARDEDVVEKVAALLYGGDDWDERDRWVSGFVEVWMRRARDALTVVGEVLDDEYGPENRR